MLLQTFSSFRKVICRHPFRVLIAILLLVDTWFYGSHVASLGSADLIIKIANQSGRVVVDPENANDLVCAFVSDFRVEHKIPFSSLRIHIAVYTDEITCDPPHRLQQILASEPTWDWKFIRPEEIRAGGLDCFDIVIMAGGRASLRLAMLESDGQQAIRNFVCRGGGYVGICAGGFLSTNCYLSLVNLEVLSGERDVPGIGVQALQNRSAGTVKMRITKAGEYVFRDIPGIFGIDFDAEYAGGPIFLSPKNKIGATVIPLARFSSEVSNHEFHRGTMIQTPSIIAAQFGQGRVIVFSPHPEISSGLEPLVRRAIFVVAPAALLKDGSTLPH